MLKIFSAKKWSAWNNCKHHKHVVGGCVVPSKLQGGRKTSKASTRLRQNVEQASSFKV